MAGGRVENDESEAEAHNNWRACSRLWSLKVKKKVTWVGPEGRNLKGGRCSEREVSLNLWPWPAQFLAML